MKTHIASDDGLILTPTGRRLLWAVVVIGLLIAIGWALTDRTEAASTTPASCAKYQFTCTQYRSLFGLRYCNVWTWRCIGAPAAKVDGLASYRSGQGGKCTRAQEWRGLQCTVADAGVGWVYGDCAYGLAFSARTARTFTAGQLVTVSGCRDQWGNIQDARISR